MKIKIDREYHNEMTIIDFVEEAIEQKIGYYSGLSETTAERARALARTISRLIYILCEKGILKKEDLQAITNHDDEIIELV